LVNQLPPRGEPISQIECHSTDSVFKFKARFLLLHVPDGGRVDGKGLSINNRMIISFLSALSVYVCPEPALVKRSCFGKMAQKDAFSYLDSRLNELLHAPTDQSLS
jgi:hypothetical protein